VYDSKKSGAARFHTCVSAPPIRAPYLIRQADFVACHQFNFVEKVEMLPFVKPGATFLLNSPFGPKAVWDHLPRAVQQEILDKNCDFT
jgi:pyruvate-ferredoxin/flavodoxin oxidoreductase